MSPQFPRENTVGAASSGSSDSLRRGLERTCTALRSHDIPDSRIEAEVLLRYVLGLDRSDFLTVLYGDELHLTSEQTFRIESVLARRLGGEPLAYITGNREFYGLEFEVTPDVLIPRQETELLVDLALEYLKKQSYAEGHRPVVVDVGTGSGAIALSIAANFDEAEVYGTDVSQAALDVARRNAARLGLEDRVSFLEGDLLDGAPESIDIVVSNPPYIPSGQMADLQIEVRQEPIVALDGGADGLDVFKKLLNQANGRISPGGVMIVELMPEQMDDAKSLVERVMSNIENLSSRVDLMGSQRALVVENGG